MRKPAMAGVFYEQDSHSLGRQLHELWPEPPAVQVPALAAMVPHAGYMYSGKIAAQVYARLQPSDIYVLLGPNHHAQQWPIVLAHESHWQTPLGSMQLNQDVIDKIVQVCPSARIDDRAHRQEHSLEVQVPFLQQISNTASIVPILVGTWDTQILSDIGRVLATLIQGSEQRVLIVASSDMNHFENLIKTQQLDHMALEKIEALDPSGLMQTVIRNNISMCGAAPTVAMLYAAKHLGATSAELVAYGTSADAGAGTDRVVGYAGVIVH